MKDKNTRMRILEVAEEEFLMKGFSGARTTEIARNASVNHALLHYYFSTKELLFEQVMEEKIKQLRELMLTAFEVEGMPVVEKIVEVVVSQFEFFCQHPDLPRFVINEVIAQPEYIEKIKQEMLPGLKDSVAHLQRDLDAAARKGEVRQMDASTLLMDILSVNVFSFIVAPILSTASPDMDFPAYYSARCQENVQLILNRINPDI